MKTVRLRPLGAAVLGGSIGVALSLFGLRIREHSRAAVAEARVDRLRHRAAELDALVQALCAELQQADHEGARLVRDMVYARRGEEPPLEDDGVEFSQVLPDIRIDARGTVLAAERGRVQVSIGADDGVVPGAHLSIVRGSQFIGQVVVERVDLDHAWACTRFVADGQAVHAGDDARTRLGERAVRAPWSLPRARVASAEVGGF